MKMAPQPEIAGTLLLSCRILAPDIRRMTAEVPELVETRFIPSRFHADPAQLRRRLQQAIDRFSQGHRWKRILLGYGICGLATVPLRAAAVPLFVPRVHDCTALFLGSDREYREQFDRCPGTLTITEGWYQESGAVAAQDPFITLMGSTPVTEAQLAKRYGTAHARKTLDFLNSWKGRYERVVFVDTGWGTGGPAARHARRLAETNGWRFEVLNGDLGLLSRLLKADTSTGEILEVPPGRRTAFDPANGTLGVEPDPGPAG